MAEHQIKVGSVGIQVNRDGAISSDMLRSGTHSTDYQVFIVPVYGFIPVPLPIDTKQSRVQIEYDINPAWLPEHFRSYPGRLFNQQDLGVETEMCRHASDVITEELRSLLPQEERAQLPGRSGEAAGLRHFDRLGAHQRHKFLEVASANLMLVVEHHKPGSFLKLRYCIAYP